MEISTEVRGACVVINLRGSLEHRDINLLKTFFREVRNFGACQLVLNLASVPCIPTKGWVVLLGVWAECCCLSGRLALCEMNADVAKCFQDSGLNNVFKYYQTESEAVASYSF